MHEDSLWPVIHSLGDFAVQGGYTLGPRVLNDYELVYFPEGTSTVYSVEGAADAVLDEPSFILTRPGESHLYRFDPDRSVRHLFVHFDYAPLARGEARFQPLLDGGGHLPAKGGLAAGLMRQMLRVANLPSPEWKAHIAILLAAALEELRAEAARHPHTVTRVLPLPIQKAIAYMDEHLDEPLTVEEVARQSGWSHEHFTRVFASVMGISPKRALLERRLLRAESLMLRGAGTVKHIAFTVGFRDEHHFSKMYKRIRGITPSAYMERSKDPLYRHTASEADPDTPYPLNRYIVVDDHIK